MNRYLPAILVLGLSLQGSIASAEMLLQSYDAKNHDRFYAGPDKAFIGDPFGWSGVGRVVGDDINLGWATMVSQRYFLSAAHFHPAIGDTLRFYKTNDPLGQSEDHIVEAAARIAGTDLWLGKLQTPVVDAAIYPVLKLASDSDYDNRVIYTFGRSNTTPQETNVRLGRNTIDPGSIGMRAEEPPSTVEGMSFTFDFDYPTGGVGADESYLQTYDSGGPSFAIYNGPSGPAPALVGIHWFIEDEETPKYSGDTFVPGYIAELNEAMDLEQLTVVPEPSALAMLLGLGVVCLVWGGWRRAGRAGGP